MRAACHRQAQPAIRPPLCGPGPLREQKGNCRPWCPGAPCPHPHHKSQPTKVRQLHVAPLCEQDVAALDVPVHLAQGVEVRQALRAGGPCLHGARVRAARWASVLRQATLWRDAGPGHRLQVPLPLPAFETASSYVANEAQVMGGIRSPRSQSCPLPHLKGLCAHKRDRALWDVLVRQQQVVDGAAPAELLEEVGGRGTSEPQAFTEGICSEQGERCRLEHSEPCGWLD